MDFEKSTLTLIDGLLLLAVIGAVGLIAKSCRDWRDKKKIYRLLQESSGRFRSTHAIASNTGIGESRVTKLCESDKRLRRNELEKESWTLRDTSH